MYKVALPGYNAFRQFNTIRQLVDVPRLSALLVVVLPPRRRRFLKRPEEAGSVYWLSTGVRS